MTGLQPLILIVPAALIFVVVAVAYWFIKSGRRQDGGG